jgi:hypothetical protein
VRALDVRTMQLSMAYTRVAWRHSLLLPLRIGGR